MARTCRSMSIACLLAMASTAKAQEADTAVAATQPAAMPSVIRQLPDYTGDLWSRSALIGDWGGARTELAENGIFFEADLTQILQGNAHGGADTNKAFRYSGSIDYTIKFDTARMGLWPAGLLLLKGETQFGQSLNSKVGSVMSANADALFPVPDDPGVTTLTDVVYTQFLSEKFGFAIGKIDFRGGDQNIFAHSETTQFMNLALLANPILLPYGPYTALMAGIFFRPTEWLAGSIAVLDSNASPTEAGFDTAFHRPRGTTFFNEWDVTVRPFGLPGHQRFGIAYSNKEFSQLDQDQRIRGPITLIRSLQNVMSDPETRPDDWAFYYNFDQYLYTEPDDPDQGFGLFGRFGWSSGEVNPFETFYSIGLGGRGMLPTRDNDTYGVGYYYMNMSGDLPDFLGLSSEQGVELYYSIEVTPWLHITPDLQIIHNPGASSDRDVAIVYGLRAHMTF